jgi:hypothetical protein
MTFPFPNLSPRVASSGYPIWQIYITAGGPGGGLIQYLNEVELLDTAGGTDQATGGTASVDSSSSGFGATEVFDDTNANAWASANSAFPHWAKYTKSSPFTVGAVTVASFSGVSSGHQVRDFSVRKSVDDSTFYTEWKVFGQYYWNNSSASRLFIKPARLWRVRSSADNGSGVTAFGEIEFRASTGGADQSASGYSSTGFPFSGTDPLGNDYTADKAFNNNGGTTFWAGSTPCEVGFAFATAVSVAEVAITTRSDGFTSDAPKDFTIDYSDDYGDNWTTARTVTGETGWSAGETRTYSVP